MDNDLDYLDAAKKFREEEEDTKCPDCGVSFGLHHVDCPLKNENFDDPVLD